MTPVSQAGHLVSFSPPSFADSHPQAVRRAHFVPLVLGLALGSGGEGLWLTKLSKLRQSGNIYWAICRNQKWSGSRNVTSPTLRLLMKFGRRSARWPKSD